MKVFWAILIVCMLACGALVYSELVGGSPATAADQASTAASSTAKAEASNHPVRLPPALIQRDGDTRAALAEELLASSEVRQTASGAPAIDTAPEMSGVGSDRAPTVAGAASGGMQGTVDTASTDSSALAAKPGESGPAAAEAETENSVSPTATPASAATLEPVEFAIEPIKGTSLLDSTFVRKTDGTLLVDDRYAIRGEGTKENPFEVSWDMLISASQSYQPRLGETALPGRIAMLHEKHVRITGYLAFPVSAESFDEMLVMLNQWDGCCIGVPPSPYDAIEVKLAEPVNIKKRHMFVYGTVEGRMLIEPYLINEWLVGLYLMQDAKVQLDY